MKARLAAELRVHRQQLNRSFVACVRHSPKEEIDQVRADRLRALLVGSTMPVKQIAYDMDFSSPSQLIRFCRRILGRSPLEIRGSSTR
jgi:transcriptional regulator GlxA family with amidase domain